MRPSRRQPSRALERVRGELVDPEIPVARPVAPRRGAPHPASPQRTQVDVVHHHVHEAAPAAPPVVAPRRVPVWAIVVAYFAMAIGIVLLVLALSSGPIIQPPHTPTTTHHHGRTAR